MTHSRPRMLFAALLLTAFAGATAMGQESDAPHRERIEWCDIWFTGADKEDLPRVLLIGDSIARGYFDGVERELAGKAYCGRLTSSRSVCDPVFFQELSLVLGQYACSVIHFNNGLHGWDYTEDEYREGFSRFLEALREQAPDAALICALTTPVQPDSGMGEHADRVAARNAIAVELCRAAGIAINDLHALSDGKAEHFSSDGIHFSGTGKVEQGAQVASAILDAMR